MFDIENDRLFWYYTSSSPHGGATSSALAKFRSLTLVHHASMGVDRWGAGGGTCPDAISTSMCRLRSLTNECRLEEDEHT